MHIFLTSVNKFFNGYSKILPIANAYLFVTLITSAILLLIYAAGTFPNLGK
jgi:hypothetical protein